MSFLRHRPGEAGGLDTTRPRMPAESRWRALVNAAAAVRSTDPAHITASSSVRVVKMSLRLRPDEH